MSYFLLKFLLPNFIKKKYLYVWQDISEDIVNGRIWKDTNKRLTYCKVVYMNALICRKIYDYNRIFLIPVAKFSFFSLFSGSKTLSSSPPHWVDSAVTTTKAKPVLRPLGPAVFSFLSRLSAQARVQRNMATSQSNATGMENPSNCLVSWRASTTYRHTGLGGCALYARVKAPTKTVCSCNI